MARVLGDMAHLSYVISPILHLEYVFCLEGYTVHYCCSIESSNFSGIF